ncbi:MAG: 2-hydroxyacid dehydrogenase [Granulosicoccus sp.]
MKVLLTKAFAPSDLAYLTERVASTVTFVQPESFDTEGVLAKISEADVLFGGMINEAVLSQGQHLKLIQIPWTGVDNLNFDMLAKFSTPISNSHSNADIVAEHTIAMLLGIARKLPYHDRQMRDNQWNRLSKDGNKVSPFSSSIVGKRILYVGFGAIAQACSRLLAGFGMQTAVVNTSGNAPAGYSAPVDVFSSSDIARAVVDQDIVVIALPLTEDSRSLIDQTVFEAMSSDALLVNVSRGAIVDEKALFDALNEERIAGAAIDTWYQAPNAERSELPPSDNYDFASLDNLLMSPHRAGYAIGGFPHLDDAIVNLNNLVEGRALINVIDPTRRY